MCLLFFFVSVVGPGQGVQLLLGGLLRQQLINPEEGLYQGLLLVCCLLRRRVHQLLGLSAYTVWFQQQ